jgi:hypothetical protein
MSVSRGTSNTNDRGSSYDRRRRRERLEREHSAGDGRVYCFHCGKPVAEWEIDRWPVCGHAGGRYTLDNIVPACRPCNARRGVACRLGRCSA